MISTRTKFSRAVMAWAVAAVAWLVTASDAPGTTLARMSVNEMTRHAAIVIRARCLANRVQWDSGEMWTFTTFAAEETWKGATAETVRVRLLGGRAGDVTSTVAGVPRFRVGEEVVLFLEPTGRGDDSVVSWIEGTFRIHRDIKSGRETVTQDTAGFEVYNPVKREFQPAGIRSEKLADFKVEVQAAIAADSESRR